MESGDPEPTSSGGRRWMRLVLVLALGLGVVAPVLFAIAWFRFAGGRFGWLLTALAFAAVGFVCGWLAVSKDRKVARWYLAVGLAVSLGLAGILTAHLAPPTAARLREAIRDVDQSDWTLISDHASGNPACLDECTTVTRTYGVDRSFEDVSAAVDRAMHGLNCPPPDAGVVRVRWLCRYADDIEFDVQLDKGATSPIVTVIATSG